MPSLLMASLERADCLRVLLNQDEINYLQYNAKNLIILT